MWIGFDVVSHLLLDLRRVVEEEGYHQLLKQAVLIHRGLERYRGQSVRAGMRRFVF